LFIDEGKTVKFYLKSNQGVNFFENKKAQVTVFIIIAIVIVAVLGLFFILRGDILNPSPKNDLEQPELVTIIKDKIESCLTDTVNQTLFLMGLQGGFYQLDDNLLVYSSGDIETNQLIAYYLISSQIFFPNTTEMEKQLSLGVESLSPDCLDDIVNEYSDKGVSIKYSFDGSSFSSTLDQTGVNLNSNFLISIRDKNNSYSLENFETTYSSDFLKMYSAALEMVEEQKKHLDSFCITCYDPITSKYNIQIKTIETEFDGGYVIIYYLYPIQDNSSLGDPFIFAYKFYGVKNETQI